MCFYNTYPAALVQPVGQEDGGRVLGGDAQEEGEEDQDGNTVTPCCFHVVQVDLGAQVPLLHFLWCSQLASRFGSILCCSV